jgi:hypothetical protein
VLASDTNMIRNSSIEKNVGSTPNDEIRIDVFVMTTLRKSTGAQLPWMLLPSSSKMIPRANEVHATPRESPCDSDKSVVESEGTVTFPRR